MKNVVLFLSVFALAACAAPPLTLYTLADQAGGASAPPLGVNPIVIEVARVTIPDDLDTEDILLHDGNVLKRSKTGRWASRLSMEITSLVTHDLAARDPEALVTNVRQLVSPADRLLISITRLEITAQGNGLIAADWQIVPQNAATKLGHDRAQFSLSGPVATDQDIVALEGKLTSKLAAAIALPSGS